MPKTTTAESRARALLAVPEDERAEDWIDDAWLAAGTLRGAGQARRAHDIEDAAERAEQLADASAGEVRRDRWPGSRWMHRGERVTIRIVAGPQLRDGVPSVKIRDGRALRWEPIAFILEGFERVAAEAAPEW
jgi:hypothetical protein